MQRFPLLAFLLAAACAIVAGIDPTAPVLPGLLALGAVALALGVTSVVVDALLRIAMAVRGVEFELRSLNRTADQQASSVHRQAQLQSETVDLCRQQLAVVRKATQSST